MKIIRMTEKALSIRQPWAWLIVNCGKDIENRDWPTKFRGEVLIHTGKTRCSKKEYGELSEYILRRYGITVPDRDDLEYGGIVGKTTIVDCVTESSSKWYMGSYGFVLEASKPLNLISCKGQLGFFKPQLKEAK